MQELTLNRHITYIDYKYSIQYNFNDQDEISRKAMGNSWWMELRSWSTNKMHGEEQPEKRNYITQWSTDWRTDTQSLWLNHRSPQGAPGAKDLRPTCHPRSQCPTVAQTMGVSHRRGWGGPGGRRAPPCIMVVMPTASSYVPFHITQALVNVAGRC